MSSRTPTWSSWICLVVSDGFLRLSFMSFGCPGQVNHGSSSRGSLCLFLSFFFHIFIAIGFVPISVLSSRWRDQ